VTDSLLTDILLAAGAAFVLLCIYYAYIRIRKPKYQETPAADTKVDNTKDREETGGYGPIMAGVYDNESRRVDYFCEIPAEIVNKIVGEHGTLGRQWNRDGKYIYAMVKDKKYTSGYCPINIEPRSDNDPVKLHYDMQQPEIAVLMNMEEEKNFLQKYGMVLWWVAVMAFIIFMIMSSRGQ